MGYQVNNGLREGAVLSPLIYKIFSASLMRVLRSAPLAKYGMHVGNRSSEYDTGAADENGEWCGAQMWADDIVIMSAHSDFETAKRNMKCLMSALHTWAEGYRVTI